MILKFGVKNFFCFNEWMIIDFSNKTKRGVSNSICLKGANSSGKTNALKSLSFLSDFCTNSFNRKPEDKILFETFFNNNNPSEFFIDFKHENIEYSYESILNKDKVICEKIYRKEIRKTLVLSRNGKTILKNVLFSSKKHFPLRENASIISTARQFVIKEIDILYEFFNKIIYNVNYYGLTQGRLELSFLSSLYYKNTDMKEFVNTYIRKFDKGIESIKINSFTNENKEKKYFPVFIHKTDLTRSNELPIEFQSSGTKSLYYNLYYYFLVLNNGGLLCLDEFDINLHPDILPPLIELFDNKEINALNAQIIFSTHNTDIIDSMGKYRTYLFNKENGESYCYRLDELSENAIRNDRPISPLYKAGKLGGVPIL